MQVQANAFWLPKRGNAPEEYEDAFWPRNADVETQKFRCAVADGATESSFARQWARALAKAYWQGRLRHNHFVDDVVVLQERWQQAFAQRQKGLPWFAQQKARQGAFSSLVGLTIHPARESRGPPQWQALAVGDSNMFQVRDGQLVTAFPLTQSAEFHRGPFLVSSRPDSAQLAERLQQAGGEWQPGDSFYLMTDALAAWFLASHERGELPWQLLDALPPESGVSYEFALLVIQLREQQQLHNDDVTLVRVKVVATAAAPVPVASLMAAPAAVAADPAAGVVADPAEGLFDASGEPGPADTADADDADTAGDDTAGDDTVGDITTDGSSADAAGAPAPGGKPLPWWKHKTTPDRGRQTS